MFSWFECFAYMGLISCKRYVAEFGGKQLQVKIHIKTDEILDYLNKIGFQSRFIPYEFVSDWISNRDWTHFVWWRQESLILHDSQIIELIMRPMLEKSRFWHFFQNFCSYIGLPILNRRLFGLQRKKYPNFESLKPDEIYPALCFNKLPTEFIWIIRIKSKLFMLIHVI